MKLNKGRSASKDNLGILFPEEKKNIESSPRRKLPSIREHNTMEEDLEEGNFKLMLLELICLALPRLKLSKQRLNHSLYRFISYAGHAP